MGRLRITDRDRAALEFAAEHRLVLAAHVQALLDVSATVAYGRLRALTVAGLLEQDRIFHARPGCYRTTAAGLGLVGSRLPRPRIDLRCYDHDVGVAWLWLAAHRGAFGDLAEIVSERRLRSHDAGADGSEPLGVRVAGVGPRGGPRRHYPDLILTDTDGHRIALELELSAKGARRLGRILAAYAADARIDAVVYLTDDRAIARRVQAAARRVGISPLVHVQPVGFGAAGRPSAGMTGQRRRTAQRSSQPSGQRTA